MGPSRGSENSEILNTDYLENPQAESLLGGIYDKKIIVG